MTIKSVFVTLTSLLIITACSKSNVEEINSASVSKAIKLEGVVFSKNMPVPNVVDPTRYDEGACTIKVDTVWVAGTICFVSNGNTCNKKTNCIPLQNAAKSGKFTKEEIDQKIKIIESAYGIKYVY